jgi:protein involved in polysaccharide export with SLBB domain
MNYLTSPSRWATRLVVLSLLAGFSGLASCTPPPVIPPSATAPWPLGPGDRLRIIVFDQNQLGGEFAVDQDGSVSLPLIGRLKVAGLLPVQAERLITERLSAGLVKNPKVNIDVIHYRPVFVYGEVTRPGAYEPTGNLVVVGAVSLAGGFTYRAQTDAMTIIRAGDPDHQSIPVGETTPVGPGDVIYVPERWF